MSLLSVPFVGTGADTALHVVAAVVLIASVAGACYGFGKSMNYQSIRHTAKITTKLDSSPPSHG